MADWVLHCYAAGQRYFGDVDLRGEDLHQANLSEANFTDADLRGVNLSRAQLSTTYFGKADLREANLEAAIGVVNMCYADLRDANLVSADLQGSNLVGANLQGANLSNANLQGANLGGANLREANLGSANLQEADLSQADLSGAVVDNALMGGVRIGQTTLVGVDLCPLCDAVPSVKHYGPSFVDHRAILLSARSANLGAFLQRIGLPEVMVEYNVSCALALTTDVFRLLRSTFISYGEPDLSFATKLYNALHRNGVVTFFFPEHATPGEKLHREVRKGIAMHERVILICSRFSLDREPVLFEIEEALTREAKMKGESLLIPIRLDRYVLDEWKPPDPLMVEAVRSRVVADFENADTDQEKFQRGLRQLIAALRK